MRSAPSLGPRDQSLLAELIHQTFGTDCWIDRYEIVRQELDYTVLQARLQQPELHVVVKLAGQMCRVPCPFDRSAAINRMLRTYTNIPNSAVIAHDISYQQFPWSYMISTWIPGETLASIRPHLDDTQRRDVARQMGTVIATMHTVPFEQFGELAPNGTLPFGAPFLQALADRVRRRIHDQRRGDLFLEALREHSRYFAGVTQAQLTHEDLNPDNLIFHLQEDRWVLAGVLDFESAWAGCHESDLARLELWHGMTSEDFWDAYSEVRAVAPEYPRRRPLFQLLWCIEYGARTPQHVADIRAVCRTLGIAPGPFLA